MKSLSLVTLSLLVVLSTACSKSVRLDGNQSGTTDLSAGVSGGGSDGSTGPGSNPSPTPTASSSTGVNPSPTPSSSSSVSPSPSPSSSNGGGSSHPSPSPSPSSSGGTTGTGGGNPIPSPSPSHTLPPVSCSGGQTAIGSSCVCPGTDGWDGKNCISCADNQLWNPKTQTCDNTCKQGMYATAAGGCTSCPSGQAWDGTECVSSTGSCSLTTETCDSYKELTSPFVIPERDCSHTCYYIKLSSKVALQNSDDFTVYDQNVLARDHDNYSDLNPKHPHIIGSSSKSTGAVADVQFVLQGEREIMLSGNTSGTQDVYVDNFVLVQLGMGGQTSYYGEGSSDSVTYTNSSVAGDNGYINVAGSELKNYLVGASGGTSNFTPINFGPELQLNTVIDFKSEALDCGQVGQVSDIYLLFR
jgi:hypothetical protein